MSTVQSMVAELGKNKTSFLDDVESSINSYISHRSWQECLTIVERYSDGCVRSTWELIHALEDSMQINISQIASDSIHTLTTHVVAAAASVPISKAVAVVLLKNMAIFLKGAVAKVMATTAVKTMLATTVKKLVAVKIVAALIALVAPSLGSVSIWWIVAPLLAAFIAYEVSNLPENMGEKVSSAVRQELSGEFDNLNKNVVTQIMSGLTSSALGVLASDIAKDEIFKEILDKNNK